MADTSKEASASDKVLSTPELLEAILLNLSQRDLLLDQRVSQFWRDTITNSPNIQQKLFFNESSTEPPGGSPVLNPAIEYLLGDDEAFVAAYSEDHLNLKATRWAHDAPECDSEPHVYLFRRAALTLEFDRLDGGSFDSMLISDPPCPVFLLCENGIRHHCYGFEFETVGELLEELKERQADCIREELDVQGIVTDEMLSWAYGRTVATRSHD